MYPGPGRNHELLSPEAARSRRFPVLTTTKGCYASWRSSLSFRLSQSGIDAAQQFEKGRTVVLVAHVAQLVGDDIVDSVDRCPDQHRG